MYNYLDNKNILFRQNIYIKHFSLLDTITYGTNPDVNDINYLTNDP